MELQLDYLHQFVGKESFTVKDFIYLLNKLNPEAEVVFGVLYEKGNKDYYKLEFNQNENIVFRLGCFTGEDIINKNYQVQILTKA